MTKTGLLLLGVLGCSEGDEPAGNPPPPWGAPISGGTLLVSRDGAAVVGDPDRDRVVMIDLATERVLADVALPGDEPGRILEDAAGRIHVALRRGGALVTFASARGGDIVARRPACPEPRGLAYEAARDLVHVACAGGELVSFPAAGGAAARTLRLDRDLRDVVVSGSDLIVTRFRSAELLTVSAQGTVTARAKPPTVQRFSFGPFDSDGRADSIPTVAWRAVAAPGGGVLITHQRQLQAQLSTDKGGYGGGCGGPVESAVSLAAPGAAPVAVRPFAGGALPVDLAVNPAGTQIAVAMAGAHAVHVASSEVLNGRDKDDCGLGGGGGTLPPGAEPDIGRPGVDGGFRDELGAPTALAYTPSNDLVVFYPEAPALVVRPGGTGAPRAIVLPGEFGYDAGRAVFHGQTAVGLACASCHPEGREDGLVWDFADLGVRRTQSLAGGILERGPYHWAGDMKDLGALMEDVFSNRMAGGSATRSQKLSLGPWLDRIPAPAPIAGGDPAAIARGEAVFAAAGCGTCHGGALLTNNALVDVGTGGKFKVPSLLGVAARAPFMHTGCAGTLRDRFTGACGGGDAHGVTSTMTDLQIDDLVAYLESL